MCPYCQKTFKTNVNCKKHMKTHRGQVAAEPAIGEYQGPQLIIEVMVVFDDLNQIIHLNI